jgi:hypothetical protein
MISKVNGHHLYKNRKPIYFVTVFWVHPESLENEGFENPNEDYNKWESSYYKRKRCWGWYKDLERAERCVKENWGDIYENGYYNLALIEPITEGMIGVCPGDERWFKVVALPEDTFKPLEEYKIVEIQAPKIFANICGWSLG